jgi:hypothetical protein
MFSPQSVEKPNRERRVFTVQPDEPLPWESGHELARQKLRPNQAWRHVVYLGIYRLDAMYEVLARVFSPDQESFDERPAGESAVAVFVVGEDGHALIGSEVLSSCAWATGQVLREGRARKDWIAGFDMAASMFGEAWRELVTEIVSVQTEDETSSHIQVPRLLGRADLRDCLDAAVAEAGIDKALSCVEIRISSQIVARRRADSPGGHEFLNSFIVDDLDRIAGRAARGDVGAALRDYLRPEAEIRSTERVDVRANPDVVLAATAPDTVPAGRWLSQPDHALVLNQQLAVNTAMSMTGTGILGVNGPPGTGKTTMLRDLIAALVVERARRLAALSDPKKAFAGGVLRWRTGERTRVVSTLRSDLTGFEMVVASANNGAVQNVTDEIPAVDAIDESWREQATAVDYFSQIASALLASDSDATDGELVDPSTSTRAWALVAARLGNKSNRGRFVNTFWYHKPPDEPSHDQAWSGLLSVLKGYEQTPPDRSWSVAVADFRAAEARERTVRAERSTIHRATVRRTKVERELADLRRLAAGTRDRIDRARERREAALRNEREQQTEAERVLSARRAEAERIARERRAHAEQLARQRIADAKRMVEPWEAELSRRWRAHAQHRQVRPGLWDWLRTFGASGRQWSQHEKWLANEVRTAQSKLDSGHQELRTAQDELAAAHRLGVPGEFETQFTYQPLVAARRELALADEEIDAATRALTEGERGIREREAALNDIHGLLDRAATALGKHYPDATWWEDRERRELAALWTDQEWNVARSGLFLAALRLHKALLRHTPTEMRRNLQAAMDIISGDVSSKLPDGAALAAWQSLFVVVPVVSTTFASYARLFEHLDKEALGWLLIDEAGQATPQNAVGALWRTRRAVIVGDPLQLEPITTLPFRAEQTIRNELGVDEQWSTSRTSVQRLADRLTSLGTSLPDDDGQTWVGIPLTVHRRCDQPMFDIINTIAYDGLMIDGTSQGPGKRFDATYPTLPPSKWIDVVGDGSQGHWIPDEGRELDRILRTLDALDFDMSEVMVIGPFRDIARQIRGRSRRYPGLVAGTVHTAQGKQADIVVLVLGSAPDRPGARRWAASKPNLLNVAVSRAKRRLYVIGNRQAWSTQRYFDTLAVNLPHAAPARARSVGV